MRKAVVAALLLMVSLVANAEWYEGGTLHQESALAWQQADYDNKLATAGDFIAAIYQQGKLSPDVAGGIRNMDDMHALSDALVTQLDDAFEPDPDPAENRRMFANQSIRESAVLVMLMMGWISP